MLRPCPAIRRMLMQMFSERSWPALSGGALGLVRSLLARGRHASISPLERHYAKPVSSGAQTHEITFAWRNKVRRTQSPCGGGKPSARPRAGGRHCHGPDISPDYDPGRYSFLLLFGVPPRPLRRTIVGRWAFFSVLALNRGATLPNATFERRIEWAHAVTADGDAAAQTRCRSNRRSYFLATAPESLGAFFASEPRGSFLASLSVR